MSLSNAYGNRIDDLVDSSNKEDIISRRRSKNTTSPKLLSTKKNRVAGHSIIEEGVKEWNKVTGHSERGEKMEDINGDMSEVSFLN